MRTDTTGADILEPPIDTYNGLNRQLSYIISLVCTGELHIYDEAVLKDSSQVSNMYSVIRASWDEELIVFPGARYTNSPEHD